MTCCWHLVRQPPYRSHLPVQTGEVEVTGTGSFNPEIHPGCCHGRFHGCCQDCGRRWGRHHGPDPGPVTGPVACGHSGGFTTRCYMFAGHGQISSNQAWLLPKVQRRVTLCYCRTRNQLKNVRVLIAFCEQLHVIARFF